MGSEIKLYQSLHDCRGKFAWNNSKDGPKFRHRRCLLQIEKYRESKINNSIFKKIQTIIYKLLISIKVYTCTQVSHYHKSYLLRECVHNLED